MIVICILNFNVSTLQIFKIDLIHQKLNALFQSKINIQVKLKLNFIF